MSSAASSSWRPTAGRSSGTRPGTGPSSCTGPRSASGTCSGVCGAVVRHVAKNGWLAVASSMNLRAASVNDVGAIALGLRRLAVVLRGSARSSCLRAGGSDGWREAAAAGSRAFPGNRDPRPQRIVVAEVPLAEDAGAIAGRGEIFRRWFSRPAASSTGRERYPRCRCGSCTGR